MALTQDQIFEHIGRMVVHGFDNHTSIGDHQFERMARWAKQYVLNDTFGTQAERQEAMRTIKRKLFEKTTGMDPDVDKHFYENHWSPDVEDNQ